MSKGNCTFMETCLDLFLTISPNEHYWVWVSLYLSWKILTLSSWPLVRPHLAMALQLATSWDVILHACWTPSPNYTLCTQPHNLHGFLKLAHAIFSLFTANLLGWDEKTQHSKKTTFFRTQVFWTWKLKLKLHMEVWKRVFYNWTVKKAVHRK